MKKYLALLLLFCLFWGVASPVEAAYCRQRGTSQICILYIKRSAKYWWEYRASVSIDGKKRPIEVYNCRRGVRITRDGTKLPFEADGPGELICTVLN